MKKSRSVTIIIFSVLLLVCVCVIARECLNGIVYSNRSEQIEGYLYHKTIDGIEIELTIPNDWTYEELPQGNFYKYALKIYKNKKEEYTVLYQYNQMMGVCGTGRSDKEITLNNGDIKTIGYYDCQNNWSDVFLSDNGNDIYLAFLNYGLIGKEADEMLDIIKTINITKNKNA